MGGDEEKVVVLSDYLGEWMVERLEGDTAAYTKIIDNIVSNYVTRLDPDDVVGPPEWQFDQNTLINAVAASKPLRDATAKAAAHSPYSTLPCTAQHASPGRVRPLHTGQTRALCYCILLRQAVVDGEWKLTTTDGDDCFVWLSRNFPGISKIQVAQSNITYITDRGHHDHHLIAQP